MYLAGLTLPAVSLSPSVAAGHFEIRYIGDDDGRRSQRRDWRERKQRDRPGGKRDLFRVEIPDKRLADLKYSKGKKLQRYN